MYFSETPTLRKVLSVTCVLCLAGSMFAGCMKKDDAPPTTTAPSIGLNLTESETPTLRKVLSVTCVLCLAGSMFAGCMKKDDAPPTTTAPSIGLNLTETTAPTTQPTVPTTEPVEINENTGVVLSQLNVRSSPSTSGFEIGVLYAGDRIELERRETLSGYEWGYLKSPMEGWIVMDYVKMDMDSTDATSDNSTPAGNGDVTPPTPTTPPASGSTTEIKGTITGNGLNIRNEPSTDSDNSTPAGNGDVTPPTPTTPPASGSTTEIKGTITGNGLNIRNEPSTDGKVQGTYNKGDSVTILEVKNGWGRTNKGRLPRPPRLLPAAAPRRLRAPLPATA